MKLKFVVGQKIGSLFVTREKGDKPAKGSGWTKDTEGAGWGAEIHLLYLVQQRLKKAGFHLCRVKVANDGHLFGDKFMNYLRTPVKDLRKGDVSYPYLYIFDGNYMLRSSAETYNNGEEVRFDLEGDVFLDHPQPEWQNKVKALCEEHQIECEMSR